MVLRPIPDRIDTLDVILKNDKFSWFSIFWIVGFDNSDRPYVVIRPNIVRLMLFSKKGHLAGMRLAMLPGMYPIWSYMTEFFKLRFNYQFLRFLLCFWCKTHLFYMENLFSKKNLARAHFRARCAHRNFESWAQKSLKKVIFCNFPDFHETVARAEMRAHTLFFYFWIYLIEKMIFAPWIIQKSQKLIIKCYFENS